MPVTTAARSVQPRPPGAFVPDPMARFDQAARESWVFAVVVLGALVVGAMWWRDNPTGSLHNLGDQLTGLGRLTGLLGTYLVLVQLLLMARIPWLDRLIGMDRLAVWHRRNGEYSVSLLVVHAVATVLGYAAADHKGVLGETSAVVLHYPDVLMATVALGLLVGVAVLSMRAVRRTMQYHTWYFTHLYAYLAVVLAFAHQLATGDDLATHTAHRVFWVLLFVGTVGLVVAYRVVRPLWQAARHSLRVAAVVPESDDVVSIHVTGRRLEELGAEPGQFFLWRFLTRQGWWQAHPFSLSAPPTAAGLRFTVKAVGDHTSWMHRLRPGTRVMAEGPFGAMTGRRRTRNKVLLLAGGVGVTPLRALFETLPGRPGDISLVYRAASDDDVVFRHELEEVAQRRGAKLAFVLAPRDASPDPLRSSRLRKAVPDLAQHDVYVCGSPAFIDAMEASLHQAGVPRRQIHSERFEF
jgi:predicted ferric reductase